MGVGGQPILRQSRQGGWIWQWDSLVAKPLSPIPLGQPELILPPLVGRRSLGALGARRYEVLPWDETGGHSRLIGLNFR